MSYTSPSPANVGLNGNQTTWWIPARNLSTHTATNVIVTVTVSPSAGLAPVTYVADTGVFNFTTGKWNVGTLAAGTTKWLKIVTSVSDIGLAPFTVTSVISGDGVDPNNVNNTLVQTVTSVVTCATAGAVSDPNSCFCGDVSVNDTPCNYGTTEWILNPLSITNSVVYTWDNATGKYHFTPEDITQDITAQYTIWCDDVEISGPATLTIPAIVDSIAPFDHTIDLVQYEDLSVEEIAILTAQHPGLVIADYCWAIIKNGDGEVTSGFNIDCNESKARTFYACIEDECIVGDEACPCSNNIPAAVEATLPEGYTPNEGDIIFVQHPYARSVWRYSEGSGWVRDSCGCISEAAPLVSAAFTGTNTKTLTLTFEDASTVTASFTDLQNSFTLNHDTCGVSSGAGTVEDPLVVNVPVPEHYFPEEVLALGDTYIVNVSTLFTEVCSEGCIPTYTIGGYSTLAYEDVTLVGTTLTYTVKENAIGNLQIIINRECGE